ncbi:thiol-disulfide oxidoreductase DCC family protein [Robiginitalea sp. IMCC43444]|uniref:thiol-disulfide oxidoreductase DCC family protein n=1 Tax=Robiginitalea sp. IMCC43444 TaxID=3459121 RepID=UPI0040431B90
MMELPEGKKIILFDGVCNLCNRAVQFILKRDRRDVFRFASLQGETGKQLLAERGIDSRQTDSIILIDPGVAYYVRAGAAMEISRNLKGFGFIALVFGWIPQRLLDPLYNLIARNRYSWFGKRESCMLPGPETRSKFLD